MPKVTMCGEPDFLLMPEGDELMTEVSEKLDIPFTKTFRWKGGIQNTEEYYRKKLIEPLWEYEEAIQIFCGNERGSDYIKKLTGPNKWSFYCPVLENSECLQKYLNKYIAADKISPVLAQDGKTYYEPRKIIKQLQEITGREPNEALKKVLKSNATKENKPAYQRVKQCFERYGQMIIEELKREKGRRPKKKEIASRMREKYLPDINEGTVLKNFTPSRDLRERKAV